MLGRISILRKILKRKNGQIRAEREKYMAERCANVILSAYIALIAQREGEIRIPKKEISRVLGRYRTFASTVGDDYVIESIDTGESISEKGGKSVCT